MATVTFDDSELMEAYADIEMIVEQLPIDAALGDVSRLLELDEQDFFGNRRSPSGEAWTENWEPWADWKRQNLGHELPLKGRSGRLEASMTSITGDSIRDITRRSGQVELILGTSLPYAKKMEEGGPSFFALFGTTIDITPRIFAGFREDRPDTIAEAIADALVERMKT